MMKKYSFPSIENAPLNSNSSVDIIQGAKISGVKPGVFCPKYKFSEICPLLSSWAKEVTMLKNRVLVRGFISSFFHSFMFANVSARMFTASYILFINIVVSYLLIIAKIEGTERSRLDTLGDIVS